MADFTLGSAGLTLAAERGVIQTAKNYTADGAITPKGFATMSANAAALAMTLAAPTPGALLVICDLANSGANNHVVTCGAGITFDGTNNTATFNANYETLVLFAASATRWIIVENIGSVALSTV